MISNGIERGLHMKLIDEYFETAMEAWDMMQKTSGDEDERGVRFGGATDTKSLRDYLYGHLICSLLDIMEKGNFTFSNRRLSRVFSIS